MIAKIIPFPSQIAEDVAFSRSMQAAFAARGVHFGLEDVLTEVRAAKTEVLSDKGEAVARDVAARLGVKLMCLRVHDLPDHWSHELKNRYLHLTHDGYMSHADAFDFCDAQAKVKRLPSDTEEDFLLRKAKAAVALLKQEDD